ncbi:hypothetical protein [Streptomyces sp. RKCA744]|uniref:hypothetical protein n=1 Tax=Streptomyces sp. RKCA744 TaxID=2959340 RepID=UPI00209E79B7|nr:hypothetical protein [Streptomyces sp. RKCA744]MCO8308794.1 hypothetical protein [Streptomyces sp. RKCA744]
MLFLLFSALAIVAVLTMHALKNKPTYENKGLASDEKVMMDTVWLIADDTGYLADASRSRINTLIDGWRTQCRRGDVERVKAIERTPGVGRLTGTERSKVLNSFKGLC